ncbi:hypothetical protein D3C73_1356900 [compost metagenome]
MASIWFSVSENALNTLSLMNGKIKLSLLALTEFSSRTRDEDISNIPSTLSSCIKGAKIKLFTFCCFSLFTKHACFGSETGILSISGTTSSSSSVSRLSKVSLHSISSHSAIVESYNRWLYSCFSTILRLNSSLTFSKEVSPMRKSSIL